jgi:hypothetical protein
MLILFLNTTTDQYTNLFDVSIFEQRTFVRNGKNSKQERTTTWWVGEVKIGGRKPMNPKIGSNTPTKKLAVRKCFCVKGDLDGYMHVVVSIPLLFIFDHSLSTFFPHLFLHLLPYILPHLLYRYWYSPSTKTTRTRKPPPPVKKMIRRASSFNQQLRMSPSSGSPKSEAGDWQQTKKKTKNSEGLKYWGKLKAYVVGTAV